MGKPPHRLSEFIIILDEKANKSNKYCVCRECVSGSSFEDAEKNKFANTQELVRRHLKNCEYFKRKYSDSERADILEKPDKSGSVINKCKYNQLMLINFAYIITNLIFFYLAFQEDSDNSDNFENPSLKNLNASVKKSTIDRYCLRPLDESQQKHFEQLILKATVSCGWAFSWVENPEVKELFKFIFPLVKLPSRKNLGGQILAKSTQKIIKSVKEKAQNDINGVTLAYDSWKNIKKEAIFGSILITSTGKILVWNAEDISNERTKW